jgi:two-component sensor histidine kinase
LEPNYLPLQPKSLPLIAKRTTRARIDGAHLLLAPNTAQAVAVTLHELATNAAKYGALSLPNGQIKVTWS